MKRDDEMVTKDDCQNDGRDGDLDGEVVTQDHGRGIAPAVQLPHV